MMGTHEWNILLTWIFNLIFRTFSNRRFVFGIWSSENRSAMFGFGKKKDKLDREEKEKKKREKKEKKSAETGSKLTPDDLLRLDDIRRSLKIGKPEKLPSGIVADYRESGFLAAASEAGPDETAHHRPSSLLHTLTHHPPFLPPKKGILKGHRYDVTRSVSGDLDDVGVVLKNTVDNEYVNVYRRSAISPPGTASISSTESPETADREMPFVVARATTKVRPHSDHVSPVSPPNVMKNSSKCNDVSKTTKSNDAANRTSDVSSEASTPSTMDDSVWRSMLSGENLGVNHRPLSTHFPLQLPGLEIQHFICRIRPIGFSNLVESL